MVIFYTVPSKETKMKKLIILALLPLFMWANTGILLDVINENILKLQTSQGIKKVHLAGIELLSTHFKSLKASQKEKLTKEVKTYILSVLKKGDTIKYYVVGSSKNNLQYVWIHNKELNYKLIRDGYATLKVKDYTTPGQLQMRMKRALTYAQSKEFGIWSNPQLVKLSSHQNHCGTNQTVMEQRQTQLQEHINKLPRSARIMLQSKLLAYK